MANKYTKLKIDIKKVISLYESGMTQIEVAQVMGTTQRVIFTRLKEVGYKCRIAKKRNQRGDKNHMWKGSKAGYSAMHYRIRNLLGSPKVCEKCGTTDKNKNYHWANISGQFNDPKDYKRMCHSCHAKFDKIILNIKKMEKKYNVG